MDKLERFLVTVDHAPDRRWTKHTYHAQGATLEQVEGPDLDDIPGGSSKRAVIHRGLHLLRMMPDVRAIEFAGPVVVHRRGDSPGEAIYPQGIMTGRLAIHDLTGSDHVDCPDCHATNSPAFPPVEDWAENQEGTS